MNLNKIYLISFLILMISTYQTNSGIILSLLMKVLMLKGMMFMAMPLSIGAFMMGQGMGFFAGNMMGGYMMLRAANRYHHREKANWGTTGGYTSPGYNSGGWQSGKYSNAFEKGKHIGSALHSLADHKAKLAEALTRVKTVVSHKLPSPYKGWGWTSSHPYRGYADKGYQNGHHHHYDYPYSSHSKYHPVSTYKVTPYGYLKAGGTYTLKGKGYHSGGYPSSYSKGYASYPSSSYSKGRHPSSASSETYVVQDPSNTYYTSAYNGPAHEYTGK